MRRVMFGLMAALVAMPSAMAATKCANTSDRSLFEVMALKSELMVLATTCHSSAQYNAFIGRYQSDLVRYDKAAQDYFRRVYGRAAEREHDAYVTNLANAQSTFGLHQGTDFCPRNDTLYSEVMALNSPSELPLYADAKDLVPEELGACVAPTPPAAPVRRVVAKHTAKK
jgi:hypothetical protein